MKDDTLELVKFRRLKRTLNLHDYQVAGVLESLNQRIKQRNKKDPL